MLQTPLGNVRAGAADESIERSLLADAVHERLDCTCVGDVKLMDGEQSSGEPVGAEPLFRDRGTEVSRVDPRAHIDKRSGGSASNPAGCAREQHHAAFESF
jgi:hypothetical protein